MREGLVKAGNAGLVTTTGGNDLCHTMPTRAAAGPRTAKITKILAYNNVGGLVTLTFGTLNRNPAGAAFVALMPALAVLNGLENIWTEQDLPAVEFRSDETLTVAGRTGDIYVLAAGAAAGVGVTVQIEVEETGA